MALRILALLAAIGMIAGALYVRAEIIAPADPGTDAADGDGDGGGVDLVVACDDRLGSACPRGSLRMDTDELIAAFTDRSTTIQAVIAPEYVVQMIEQSGRAQVTFGGERPVAARTPMVLITAPERTAAVDEACGGGATTWECVSTSVADGTLRPAFADPTSTSDGIASFGALAGGHFAGSGGQFSLNGFSTGGFIAWLSAVQRESMTSPAPATNLVRFNGAQNDSAIVTEAVGVGVLATGGAQSMGLSAVYPEPLVVLDVVVASRDGVSSRDVGDVVDLVADVLLEQGWRADDGQPVAGGPALSDDDGLPSGGVLIALSDRW